MPRTAQALQLHWIQRQVNNFFPGDPNTVFLISA